MQLIKNVLFHLCQAMLVYYQTVESLNMLTGIRNILVNNVGNYISNYYPTRLVNPLLKFQALEQFVEWFCFIVWSTSTHILFYSICLSGFNVLHLLYFLHVIFFKNKIDEFQKDSWYWCKNDHKGKNVSQIYWKPSQWCSFGFFWTEEVSIDFRV